MGICGSNKRKPSPWKIDHGGLDKDYQMKFQVTIRNVKAKGMKHVDG